MLDSLILKKIMGAILIFMRKYVSTALIIKFQPNRTSSFWESAVDKVNEEYWQNVLTNINFC